MNTAILLAIGAMLLQPAQSLPLDGASDADRVLAFDRGTWALRKALLIGNSNYGGKAWDLSNPLKDALAIADILKASSWEKVDVYKDLDKKKLREYIREFSRSLRNEDVALFFYAGHGFSYGGNDYLMGTKASPAWSVQSIASEGLSLKDVLDEINGNNRTGPSIVIIDACRDDLNSRTITQKLEQDGMKLSFANMKAATLPGGTYVVFSTEEGMRAREKDHEDPNHSPFVKAFLDVYNNNAHSGPVYIEDIFYYVKNLVYRSTCELNEANVCVNGQDVWVKSNLKLDSRDFLLWLTG